MIIKTHDFAEIEFTAKVKETNELFDGTNINGKSSPLKICIGERMLLESFDKALEGKDIGKEYVLELSPEQAFGKRDTSLVKVIPLSVFHKKGINPTPGTFYNVDGILVKAISVSSGRIIADFNHPLSGKTVVYSYKIKSLIDSLDEKIRVLANYLLGLKDEDYEIISEGGANEAKKKIKISMKENKNMEESKIKAFAEKAKNLLQIDISVEYS